LNELRAHWGDTEDETQGTALMDKEAKRLLLFAPKQEPWREIADTWNNTMFVPSVAGTGLEEIALDEVISTIARNM
jgi:hypothetical protein